MGGSFMPRDRKIRGEFVCVDRQNSYNTEDEGSS